jgi:predicted PurR-regulated permease PerM
MKQGVVITATILTVVVVMVAVWQMFEAVQLLLLSLAVAASIAPDVQRLSRRGFSRGRAIGLSYLLAIGLLVGLVVLFGALAYGEIATVLSEAPQAYERTRVALTGQSDWRSIIGSNLPTLESAMDGSSKGGASSFAWVASIATSTISTIILIFAVASFAFYWLVDEARITRLWLSLLPLHVRVPARAMWEQIYREVGLFLRGEAIIVLLSVLLLACVNWTVGLPAAVTLALIGGLAMVVPVLGIPMALVPSGIVALMQGYASFPMTIGLSLVALLIIKHVVGPRMFKDALRINPVLQVVVIMALASTVGFAFILFAPPLAAAIQTGTRIWITEFRQMMQRSRASQIDEVRSQLAELEARLDADQAGDEQYRALLQRARKIIASASEKLPQDAIAHTELEVRGPRSAERQQATI